MSLSMQDRILIELVKKNELDKTEAWPRVSADRAVALMFENGDTLQAAATIIALSHRHGIQYIEQAPILIPAILATIDGHHQLRGPSHMAMVSNRYALFKNAKKIFSASPKLRDIMREVGAPLQFRKLHAASITYDGTVRLLHVVGDCVDPSTLSQIIPNDVRGQQHWLAGMTIWIDHCQARFNDPTFLLDWYCRFASHEFMARAPTTGIIDFAYANRERFNKQWTLERAHAESEEWHRVIKSLSAAEGFEKKWGFSFDAPIEYHPLPDAATYNGLEFVALRSAKDLYIEHLEMHHCVDTYFEDVARRRSWIYSIRMDGRRIATVQFTKGAGLNTRTQEYIRLANFGRLPLAFQQVQGPGNTPVPQYVHEAIEQFILNVETGRDENEPQPIQESKSIR